MTASILYTIQSSVDLCRENDIDPNRVRMSLGSYRLLCTELNVPFGFTISEVQGLQIVANAEWSDDTIVVDRISPLKDKFPLIRGILYAN